MAKQAGSHKLNNINTTHVHVCVIRKKDHSKTYIQKQNTRTQIIYIIILIQINYFAIDQQI